MTPAENAPSRARSQALQQRAERFFPGGVNSPVRAFRAVGGDPPFVERAEGAYLYDADGNRYIDYFGSWGPMILGHAFPPVVEAIERAARNSRQLRRIHRRRSRPRRAHRCVLSGNREAPLRQLRHRSHHVRHPPGPRRHRPQPHRQVRRLLPRPRRRPAGQSRLRRRHLRHPRLSRRARRHRRSHPRAPLQRPRRRRSGIRRASQRDRRHHRRARRRQRRLHSARARLSRWPPRAALASTALCSSSTKS